MECPLCDWTRGFEMKLTSELAAQVDAEIHFEQNHPDTKAPSDAGFGNHQCPKCLEMTGMEGNVSCGNCGFIPEEHRA